MNLPELAAATGMTKSAVQRFAFTLEALGFLRKNNESKRYSLTPKVIELGYRYLLVDDIVERASPYLLELNRKCGENINIAEPEDTDMVYIGRFPSFHYMPIYMPIGRRLPMYCTSAGRAWLAVLPEDQAVELLDRIEFRRYTSNTITDRQALLDILSETREVGYNITESEYFRGDLGISLAVYGYDNQPCAVINIAVPSSRWTIDKVKEELAPQLLEVGQLISHESPDAIVAEPFKRGSDEKLGL